MFQIVPLPAEDFAQLFALSEDELAARHIVSEIVTKKPGTPCRVSLQYAEPGERVLLLNHQHQPAQTPYQASHAICVREGVTAADLAPGELADVFKVPVVLSVRAFDNTGMLRAAELVEGPSSAAVFDGLLEREDVAYLQVHFAKYGCFAAHVERV